MCGTDDLDFALLLVRGRDGEQALTETRAPGGQQREGHPALEGRRRGGGGQVANAVVAGTGSHQLGAIAQPVGSGDRPNAHQLQPIGRAESGTLRQGPANEIAVLLQHALQAQIIGAGIAVELRCR